jgi:hypothetical protein
MSRVFFPAASFSLFLRKKKVKKAIENFQDLLMLLFCIKQRIFEKAFTLLKKLNKTGILKISFFFCIMKSNKFYKISFLVNKNNVL